MSNVLSFLLVVAVIVAGWLYQRGRVAQGRLSALETEREAVEVERKDLLRRLDRESQARARQSEELAELRRRNDKAKRRAERSPEAPLGTAARIRDVELELERAQAAARRAEAERDGLARRVEALQAEGLALTGQLERASAPTQVLEEQHRAVLGGVEGELAAVREQAAKQADELTQARENVMRLRRRIDNQEQLYASLRAELDVKKDRLRNQEELIQRLQALKAAVID
jgi:chromosome segregation ATPase